MCFTLRMSDRYESAKGWDPYEKIRKAAERTKMMTGPFELPFVSANSDECAADEDPAEGVECAEQAEILKQMGCRWVQGFHFARPMDDVSLAEMLIEIQRPAPETPGDDRVRITGFGRLALRA